MSNRIFNTDQVVDIIGLENQIKYDKIDVFVDISNKDNVFGIVYYTEYHRNRPVTKQKIIKFDNYNDMLIFVRNNFDAYELTHQVDYQHRHIFIRHVDYIGMNYYLHEGKPHLNYIELEYKEYVNGDYHIRKIQIPQENEEMFLEILRINKKLDKKIKLNSQLYRLIDVYKKPIKEKEEDEVERTPRKERRLKRERNSIPMSQPKKYPKIKNLAIIASAIGLTTVILGGYTIIKSGEYKPDVVTQKNSVISAVDLRIRHDKDKANVIIENLINGNYENISLEDIEFVADYIKEIGISNYDSNKSSTTINYNEYFSPKILENNPNIKSVLKSDEVLNKIEKLYDNCFAVVGNELIINKEAANKYINYVASLSFMYDTVVDRRNSGLVPMNTQSITSPYATQEEIMAYNQYPPILKYIILSQLKDVMYHSDYQVKERPSYYFKGLDKQDLLNEIQIKMQDILDEMKRECNNNSKKSL